MIIRPLTIKDLKKVREFCRATPSRLDPSRLKEVLEQSIGMAAEEGEDFLAVGFARATATGRFEKVEVVIRPDYRNMGLETQMLLTLEIQAERRKGKRFGVWVKSDIREDLADSDWDERFYYLARGYRFTAFRIDGFGPEDPADLLEKELQGEDVQESNPGLPSPPFLSLN